MVERLRNKKGFTIIEIMVVIALIGILAAVLVPKFGGVKDRAKDAGMLANAKMVEAYVAGVIDQYKLSEDDNLKADIEGQFNSGDNALVNPYTGETTDNISVTVAEDGKYSDGKSKGVTYVVIDSDTLDTYINGFDSKGNELEATKRTIKR